MHNPNIAHYAPLKEIRTNNRFSTFEGVHEGQKVFIKFAVDPKLQKRLSVEASGLKAMRQYDLRGQLYHVPQVVELAEDYIVTEWAVGAPMVDDFNEKDLTKIEADLTFLIEVYALIDRAPSPEINIKETLYESVDTHLEKLKKLSYETFIDPTIVLGLVEYIKAVAGSVETRSTHGDLHPSNILVAEGSLPAIVDCETYRDSWPRHYNIVNFIFNYCEAYPWLSENAETLLTDYEEKTGVESDDDVDGFNVSAALRCLQMIEEKLASDDMNKVTILYIEYVGRAILHGHLFTETYA
jgi:aminoglycoside phosphotransferase (APT) family kinase protein